MNNKLPEIGSNSVNAPNPMEYVDELGNPDKCPTCNGYHVGGCHRSKAASPKDEVFSGRVLALANRADIFLRAAEPPTMNPFQRLKGLFDGMQVLRDELYKLHAAMRGNA